VICSTIAAASVESTRNAAGDHYAFGWDGTPTTRAEALNATVLVEAPAPCHVPSLSAARRQPLLPRRHRDGRRRWEGRPAATAALLAFPVCR